MPARLKLVPCSPEATTEIVPGDHPIVIGRDPLSGVVLSEPSVSRRHAQVLRRDDALILEDLGSAVGTFVNDQRGDPDIHFVKERGQRRPVHAHELHLIPVTEEVL